AAARSGRARPDRRARAGPPEDTAMTKSQGDWVVVGLDNGGNKNNATVLDSAGNFLVDRLLETPSRVQDGHEVAIGALAECYDAILQRTGIAKAEVRVVGLDSPGPA